MSVRAKCTLVEIQLQTMAMTTNIKGGVRYLPVIRYLKFCALLICLIAVEVIIFRPLLQ